MNEQALDCIFAQIKDVKGRLREAGHWISKKPALV